MQEQLIALFEHHAAYQQSALYAFLNRPQPHAADMRYFLRWQKHFYHFVRVFSKMLARAAADIDETRHRRHLIANLMCEHGLPAGRAHVDTYRQYLQCLAAHLGQKPFADADFDHRRDARVQALAADFERLPTSGHERLLLLGGIEYMYAVISRDVVAFLQRVDADLAQQQEHYALHAELDWEHGWEFVATYLALDATADAERVRSGLLRGAHHLIAHIEKLMALEDVTRKPLGFYHAREDAVVEETVLRRYFPQAAELSVLAVCGGGENHMALASRLPETVFKVDFIDINPNQLALARAKFSGGELPFKQPEHEGKFEHLFAELRRYADLRQACDIVFHRDNLIAYFGEQAVLGCHAAVHHPLVFADHFYRALSTRPGHWNSANILGAHPMPAVGNHGHLQPQSFTVWDIAAADAPRLSGPYDFIMLSNVPDWVAEAQLPHVLCRMAQLSHAGSVLLVRKLLSDYDMAALAEPNGWRIAADAGSDAALQDPTGFYRQTFVLTPR